LHGLLAKSEIMDSEPDLEIELTEQARRVFIASRSTTAFNFKAPVGMDMPGRGDEIQFPADVAASIFIVRKRRFSYGPTDARPRVKIWLDLAD
jgi:hypothetical protein